MAYYTKSGCAVLTLFVFALLALPCAVCAADDYFPEVGLWPLFRYWRSEEEKARNADALWPLFQWRDSDKSAEFYFRPLYNRKTDKQEKITRSEFLYPFGHGIRRPDLFRSVFYPIFLRDREEFTDGTVQSRSVLLPLFYPSPPPVLPQYGF